MSEKNNGNESERTPDRFGGLILGTVFGILVVVTKIMKSSSSDFNNTPKVIYLLIILAFGVLGTLLGEKIMDKLSGWFKWL